MEHPFRYYLSKLVPLIIASLLFSGCATEEVPEYQTGTFIPGPVEGLTYQWGSNIGRTDSSGQFYYLEGEPVTFSIEGAIIGEPGLAAATTSPINLVSDVDSFVTHPKVVNMTRFLISLDNDGDPANGILISEETRQSIKNAFSSSFINFSGSVFESYSSLFSGGLVPTEEAEAHLFLGLATNKVLPVDLINLGDGFTNRTESSRVEISNTSLTETINVHSATQTGSYAAFLAGRIDGITGSEFSWHNPLLIMDAARKKTRWQESTDYLTPYNLGVHGATVKSLMTETTADNELLNELMRPIQTNWSSAVSQLDAAELVAGQTGHEGRMKLFTLWIGTNDVLGALTDGGGTKLTSTDIDAFLSDAAAGHDLTSIENNLDSIFSTLTAIPYSYVFVGNIPDVTRFGALFYKEDIEALAPFDGAVVTALINYTSALNNSDVVAVGFEAFAAYTSGLTDGVFLNVTSSGTLNTRISNLPDTYTLTKGEADKIKTRVTEINDHIAGFTTSSSIFLIDLNQLFSDLDAGTLGVSDGSGGTDYLSRTYGGGFFSLDGIRPSKTGHALIAREFIEKMDHPFDAAHAVLANITNTDDGIGMNFDPEGIDETIDSLWSAEEYRDKDDDGFSRGPGLTSGGVETIDPELVFMRDCNDNDASTGPESVDGAPCS